MSTVIWINRNKDSFTFIQDKILSEEGHDKHTECEHKWMITVNNESNKFHINTDVRGRANS